MMIDKTPLAVYIHIPFCVRKCLYCDFLSASFGEMEKELYVDALCSEITAEAEHYTKHIVETVFLGGGTPSLLTGQQAEKIFQALRSHFTIAPDAEITMEMNPGTVNKQKLLTYHALGVNRVSLGLQSANEEELRLLGRIHTWEDFKESYLLCRQAGIENINVDLMSALPGQTLASYRNTLEKTLALAPEHISSYSLILEEGTPFYERFQTGDSLPDEETDREMYALTGQLLKENGYFRYEISNYAKSGYACKHNCVYWQRGEYVGFGLGAASMVENKRWSNLRDFRAYLDAPAAGKKEQISRLSVQEQMEETMYLGLRMIEGVKCRKFLETFGKDVFKVYGPVLEKYEKMGFLTAGESICLTEKGIDVSNHILADFLL